MIVWETLYPGERATELQAVAHPCGSPQTLGGSTNRLGGVVQG
jgi:hypothetical protein